MAHTDQATTSGSSGQRRRPVGVTVVVALGILQSLIFAAAAVVVIAGRDEPEVAEAFDGSSSVLVAVGVAFAVVATVNLVLATMLARGSGLVRSIYGVIVTVELAAAVYSLVALRDLRGGSAWGLVLPCAVLWFLYGSEKTQAFFDR